MPLPPPERRTLLHERRVRCDGYEREDGLWDIEAHLLDTKTFDFPNHEKDGVAPGEPIHQMSLRLTLDIDLLIHDVAVAMDDTPFRMCRQVEHNVRQLVGIRIGSGWTRAVRERVPKTDGCTHLLDLLNPIAVVAYQTMHVKLEERASAEPSRSPPPILDQCHSLARTSEVVKIKWPDFHVESNN